MTTPLPIGSAGDLDLRADEELSWLLSLDPTVLAVLGGVLLLLLVIGVLAGWLLVRRVRRNPLVARARELGVQGATAVAARRLPPGSRRTAAELQLELARARGRLRSQIASARAAGAHLGDVPALLPSIEAEGDRLEQLLRQRALTPQPGDRTDLEPAAREHLEMLADVCAAVLEAERAAATAGRVSGDVADAVSALRAHTTAYRELTSPPVDPPLVPLPPTSPETRVREGTQG
ncbi:hypothetical protein [Blastococcus xanthinilyticus]|uniref:Uncharacterized protein n=1 Tax=Blastococcus xanthinilyticus TaxID=1564164 RepID=A0A5S5CZK2_9ACTN|nr:hypothetical protein [Blastococcus xanthinilyticus]TYP88965.1 hypothetical protein BD833_103121 [Blastococcus xanthinilyticus]